MYAGVSEMPLRHGLAPNMQVEVALRSGLDQTVGIRGASNVPVFIPNRTTT